MKTLDEKNKSRFVYNEMTKLYLGKKKLYSFNLICCDAKNKGRQDEAEEETAIKVGHIFTKLVEAENFLKLFHSLFCHSAESI